MTMPIKITEAQERALLTLVYKYKGLKAAGVTVKYPQERAFNALVEVGLIAKTWQSKIKGFDPVFTVSREGKTMARDALRKAMARRGFRFKK
jgi:hypothetical protein